MFDHPLYHWPPKLLWTEPTEESVEWGSFSAYIHFPYCRNICDFCNYETRLISRAGVTRFDAGLAGEVRRYGERDDFTAAAITSVFFGGGTASLMPLDTLARTIQDLGGLSGQPRIPEVTLECEPGTIRRPALARARQAGVNRIGVCAQSFDDRTLRQLTRKHGRMDALRLIDDAHAAGFENLHLDLMYGLPGQSVEEWRQTVEFASRLPVQHVSAYKFYVFKNGAVDRAGAAPRPEEEPAGMTRTMRGMHDLTQEVLGREGFEQYTLTEFARPGFRCDYLVNTFSNGDVLPLGPSAFGKRGPQVWHNPGFVHWYDDAARWDADRRGVRLDPAEAFKREVLLGLWLLRVDLGQSAARHGVLPGPALLALLDRLDAEELLRVSGNVLTLDERQRFEAGTVMRMLAELGSAAWARLTPASVIPGQNPLSTSPDAGSNAGKSAGLSVELRSLLRVLRRDPVFFAAIREAPELLATQFGNRIGPEERDALLTVISGQDPGPGPRGTLGMTLKREWDALRHEHHRRR